MPVVSRINVFPVKSCDGVSWSEAIVSNNGSLRHDRQFALIDSSGQFINAKRSPAIHRLLFHVDPVHREFRIGRRDGRDELCGRLDEQGEQLSDWLSDFFSLDVSLIENDETGFPDDPSASGPTVVSVASLRTVADWFPDMSIDEVRQRFRANIEIEGVEPFWEDMLFRADKQPQPFQIGDVLFGGINPCQRCVVPTRHPLTGDVTPSSFSRNFGQLREESLPPWAPREQFDHFYRLSTNTRMLDRGNGLIRVGDFVERTMDLA